MSIDGIWTGEVYGPWGWESRGIFVFEKGRVVGGDSRQYTMGSYTESGDRVTGELKIHYYGPPGALFGERKVESVVQLEATVTGDMMQGLVIRPDKPSSDLQYRLHRRTDLQSHLSPEAR